MPGDHGFEQSAVLRRREWGDHAVAELRYGRNAGGAVLTEQRSGRVNMELLKLKGSAFTRFVRDEYTTLPERSDRPLFIGLDVHWRLLRTRRTRSEQTTPATWPASRCATSARPSSTSS